MFNLIYMDLRGGIVLSVFYGLKKALGNMDYSMDFTVDANVYHIVFTRVKEWKKVRPHND